MASMEDQEEVQAKITDPKLFKSTLCQFYLKGPCKNGDSCSYAHGTSELRTSAGGSIADLESSSSDKKILYKTTLCAKFVTYGDCPFGPGCNFAHGVKELRQALEMSSAAKEEEEKAKNNPSFKTSLCKNYMMGMYCQFAANCQYAHGRHELRDKPPTVPPSQLPEEVKKRLAEKAKSLPGYKTKLCTNFENEGICQYDEMCHYAHGEEELREETDTDKEMAVQMKVKKNPFYKTIMCKSLPNCQYSENCVYAHSEAEIRPLTSNMKFGVPMPAAMMVNAKGGYKTALCKNFSEGGNCSFGTKCSFAHGAVELRTTPMDGSMMAPPAAPMGNPLYKTTMCHSVTNGGSCVKGPMCHFAHGAHELRVPGSSPMAPGFGPGSGGPGTIMIHGTDGKIKFKTSMCTVFMEQGFCPRGEACGFAHSAKQLLEAQARDPKYKTAICESWKKNGTCERGNNCIYAHGENDLRQKQPLPTAYPPQYGGLPAPVPSRTPQAAMQSNNPRYKTSMCIAFAKNGYCTKMTACQYAHGPQELRTGGGPVPMNGMSGMNGMNVMGGMNGMSAMNGMNGSNYKTAMCKNVLEQGHCQHGDNCKYAHSSAELRAKKPTGMMGMVSPMVNSAMEAMKRKRDNVKTVLCTNFSNYGECQFGDNCNFAHGPEELVSSKKQRL